MRHVIVVHLPVSGSERFKGNRFYNFSSLFVCDNIIYFSKIWYDILIFRSVAAFRYRRNLFRYECIKNRTFWGRNKREFRESLSVGVLIIHVPAYSTANEHDADARYATNICLIFSIKSCSVYPSHFERADLGFSRVLLLRPGWSTMSIHGPDWSYLSQWIFMEIEIHVTFRWVWSIIDKSTAVHRSSITRDIRTFNPDSIQFDFANQTLVEIGFKDYYYVEKCLKN